jgi:AraC-like DNA-binding protein
MLVTFDRQLELNDTLETEMVKVLYYEFDSVYKEQYKSYQYNRLCTILEGEKQVKINQQKGFTYDSSNYILLPAHSSVQMEIYKPTKALVLELSDDLLSKTGRQVYSELEYLPDSLAKEDLFLGTKGGSVEHCLKRINFALSKSKEQDKKFLLDLYVQELSYFLLKEKGVNSLVQKCMNHPVSKAIHLMKANLQPSISVNEIASFIHLSLPAFSRKFKDVVGTSPNAYYTHLKLLKAKELLLSSNVNETAWQLGFENVSHFIRLFRAKFDITPAKYSKP